MYHRIAAAESAVVSLPADNNNMASVTTIFLVDRFLQSFVANELIGFFELVDEPIQEVIARNFGRC